METTAHPKEREEREHQVDGEKLAELIPRYHVVLLDDEDHTCQYVVEMLMRLFRHGRKMSWKMASEVDQRGRVIVFATNKEQAEHKRSQIQSWGADKRLVGSKGSMSAIVEKADYTQETGMLSKEGCTARQMRLIARLSKANIDAAIISHPKEVYYFTGVIIPEEFPGPPVLLWLGADGVSLLIAHTDQGEPCVDECVTFAPSVGSTVTPNLREVAGGLIVEALQARGLKAGRLGWQGESLPQRLGMAVEQGIGGMPEWIAIDPVLADMQEVKDLDEIELLRKVVQVDLAAYAAAEEVIAPGVNELEVLAAAQKGGHLAAGEKVFHDGDYQCGEMGGFARDRKIEAGELYVIDAWSVYHNYWADLCRTFAVGEPSEVQQSVFEHIKGFHDQVGEYLRPGKDGSECAIAMDAYIREHPKLADVGLVHHAGHNVGLRAHQMPDLNKERGGKLRIGNVVSVEPGAYIPEVRAGVRLENMYLITEDGLENMSPYPMELGVHP